MPADRKTIRRRRLVLGVLVVVAIVLLTATFGGGTNGISRGVTAVISPVQDVASRALKPARDLVGWVGDTFQAKGQNERLRSELAALRQQRVDALALQRQNVDFRRLLKLGQPIGVDAMGPRTARVTGRTPTLFNQVLQIDVGASDGVARRDPVIGPDGLVGEVAWVTGGNAGVQLLTDPDFAAGAKLAGGNQTGTVQPAAGAPRELLLSYITAQVRKGDTVVTSGTSDTSRYPSLFPADVPIGVVSDVEDPGADDQKIHVRPFSDVRDLDYVRVLTAVNRSRGT